MFKYSENNSSLKQSVLTQVHRAGTEIRALLACWVHSALLLKTP
jgi:hypothetical protein